MATTAKSSDALRTWVTPSVISGMVDLTGLLTVRSP
jgi:hypothetical protein